MDNTIKQTKKELILESALRLFSENGIDATSTASIAKAASVATGTLFHHFPNKQALVHQLYLSIKHDLSQQFVSLERQPAPLYDMASTLWENALDWAITFPQKLRFFQLVAASPLLSSDEKANAMQQELGMVFKLIEVGQQSGMFADYPQALVAQNCQAQFISAGNFFIDNPQFINDEVYREASFKMFWNALCPVQSLS